MEKAKYACKNTNHNEADAFIQHINVPKMLF